MKKIPLTRGQFTLVDDADYDWLNGFKWLAKPGTNGKNFYAARSSERINGKQSEIKMHRLILGLKKNDGKECDHIDGNGLDNRRSNLRVCSHHQNIFNTIPRIGTSKYKGVTRYKPTQKWRAKIYFYGKVIQLGYFNSEKKLPLNMMKLLKFILVHLQN